jgi:transposase
MEVPVMNRHRRAFTREFKDEVVKLVLEEGRSIGSVCRELDLVNSAVRRWVQQAKIDRGAGPRGAVTTVEREELSRLRRENRQLRMERDILKRAAVFFAKESQ